ncbi:MAG: prepilin-type N-terminal cleavage/methylation domain-containing protein [bacterium]|nr:prepilin-type N-terminal cleavage/methylation domain-containing protein [bacterium]
MKVRAPDQDNWTVKSLRGFTLVELLVVVSIIALLISILLPSLRRAREQAKLVSCLANTTGISKASLTYAANDPGENMIPVPNLDVLQVASGSIEWGGKAGIGQRTNDRDDSTSLFGTTAYRGPAHRPLNFNLFKGGFKDYNPPTGSPDPGPGNIHYKDDTKIDLTIYRCPSDTGYASGKATYQNFGENARNETKFRQDGLTAYDHYGTSYAANCFWIIGGLSGQRLRSQSIFMMPMSRVPSPSATVAYQEIPSRFAWLWGSWDGSRCDYAGRLKDENGEIMGWHRQPFNFDVGFADGHASTVEMRGCIRPAPNLGLQNYPVGECDPALTSYECAECVTIRGPGWQLDTLPAASVLTTMFAD